MKTCYNVSIYLIMGFGMKSFSYICFGVSGAYYMLFGNGQKE